MRFALITVIFFSCLATCCPAQEAPAAAEPVVTSDAGGPTAPTPAQTPDYIGTPTREPLRPFTTAPRGKLITPPVAVVPPVTPPQPPGPPQPPTPKFAPTAPPGLSLEYPVPGEGMDEGEATIVWNTGGPIAYVRLSYSGENCQLGGHPRGAFSQSLGKVVNKGVYKWNVPYMDASEFKLHLVGYGLDNKQLATADVTYQFRPQYLKGKPDTCIVVSKAKQRLWYLKDGIIKRMHIISTAMPGFYTPNMHPGSYDRQRGAMGRVFEKDFAPMSREYHVIMYYWLQITASGSHGIHSTSPPFYSALGGPASHGCIRQHRADAKILWEMVHVGTPVFVQ